jgi:trigger factor
MEPSDLRVSTASPSQWGRILSIEVPRERYDAVRQAVVRDLRKRVARPGFRKGHVPAALLEREFADSIHNTTLERFLPDVTGQAIESQSLDVISTPRLRQLVLDDPQTVRLEVAFDVRPTFVLAPLTGLAGRRWTATVGDDHVQRAIESLREEHAQYVQVERECRADDFVQVSYVPLDPDGGEIQDRRVENYPFQVGAGSVVPGFDTAVRGLQPGATAHASVDYPADYADQTLAGRTVAFVLTLVAIKEKRLPEVDDEFARDLGLEDLAALRERVRADLGRRVGEESERDLRESLVDWLVQANPFEAPESMVEQYLAAALADYDQTWRRVGLEPDAGKRQEFAQAARPSAERAVRRALLLESLSKQHDLNVSEEDVDRWIEDRVQASGPGAGDVRAFFADVRRRRRLRSDLTDEKVFEFLKGQAQINEVERPAMPPDAG